MAGGAGYIGSYVCKAFAAEGYLPAALDNLSSGHASAVRLGPLVQADIADRDAVARAVQAHNTVGALHFAVKSLVGEFVRDPLKYYRENVGKGVALLEFLQATSVGTILFSSTAAVYGSPAELAPIRDDDSTRPITPYGASKLAFEEVLRSSARVGRALRRPALFQRGGYRQRRRAGRGS
ncbi:NAD-dependent epimerase/dehydratase family protein [Brevundimonas sp. M1A4_2e]